MVSSGKESYRYFIGYKDDCHKINPLCITFPKISAHLKSYDGETKWMYFFIEDDELLGKYNGIWIKVSNSLKKQLECKPIYNKFFFEN